MSTNTNMVSYILNYFQVLTWVIYYLSVHPDVEEKLYQELLSVLGPAGKVTPENIGELM